MNNWLRQHRFAIVAALGNVRRAPGSFLFNVVVVAIALTLPFAGLTLLENIRPMSKQLSVDPEISVFVTPETSRADAKALQAPMQKIIQNYKARIAFVPREDALANLNAKGSLSNVIESLGDNPLPDGYVIKLDSFGSGADAGRVDAIATALRALPGVDAVQVDSAWVKRLAALMGVLRTVLLLLAVTLSMVVVAVVFNTIRLQVMTQREEIAVSKLLGATDNFIHRPFYYTGMLLGVCAGGVALAAVALAMQPLNGAIAEFARLYGSDFQLWPLHPLAMAGLLAVSAGLGLIGAMLSVQRHLARLG